MHPTAAPLPAMAPDTICITEQQRESIQSRGADVLVRVSCTGLAQRHAATLEAARKHFEQARIAAAAISTRQVQRESLGWVAPLVALPLAAALYVYLGSVPVAVGLFVVVLLLALAGGFRWISHTTFGLSIRCSDADAVGRALDAAAAKAGIAVESVAWRYEIEPTDRQAMVERCIARAGERADAVARALGVRILGVHRYAEQHETPSEAYPAADRSAAPARRTRSVAPAAHGPLSSSQPVGVAITVHYRVGDYQPPSVRERSE